MSHKYSANDYQRDAARTAPPKLEPLPTEKEMRLACFALGLCGESGEVGEVIKKIVFHRHPMDVAKISKELGDVFWYAAAICTLLEIELETVMTENIRKLTARYPHGFSVAASMTRADVDAAAKITQETQVDMPNPAVPFRPWAGMPPLESEIAAVKIARTGLNPDQSPPDVSTFPINIGDHNYMAAFIQATAGVQTYGQGGIPQSEPSAIPPTTVTDDNVHEQFQSGDIGLRTLGTIQDPQQRL